MFDNILYQQKIKEQLSSDIRNNSLPQAILFSGNHYGGKLTTALELARNLNCLEQKKWNCHCIHCDENRVMNQFATLIIGHRDCLPEISICYHLLSKKPSVTHCIMFIRSLRKLIRRFDLLLLISDEKKTREYKKNIIGLEDILTDLYPLIKEKESFVFDKKMLDSSLVFAKELNNLLPRSISVKQVRSLIYWSRETSSDGKKIVIFEDLGDLDEGARNALLKLIEEPPSQVYLIAIATHVSRVMPTLRSRLRHYSFQQRSYQEEQVILSRLFKNTDENTLASFFSDHKIYDKERMAEDVEEFVNKLALNQPWLPSRTIPHFNQQTSESFLTLVSKTLFDPSLTTPSPGKIQFQRKILALLAEAQENLVSYGQNASLVLDSLYIMLKKEYNLYQKHFL